MKALVKFAEGPGHLELRSAPQPQPEPDEVLLKVGAVGICGTDLHILAGEYPSCRPPVTIGHELAGTIVELGREVTGWSIGDRVTSHPFAATCGHCPHCRVGQFGLCTARRSYGSHVNGAFAHYMVAKTANLYRLPEHQDFVAGCLTEPLACITKAAFDIGNLQAEESVAVLGPGAIGLLCTQVAIATGARVFLVGLKSDAARLDLGRELGAEQVFHAETQDLSAQLNDVLGAEGVDVVFECSGGAPAFGTALKLARAGGRMVQVGLFGRPVQADLDLIVYKDLKVRGSFTSSLESWRRALSLTSNGQVDTSKLVSDVFTLRDWQVAFTCASERSGLKVVVRPEESS